MLISQLLLPRDSSCVSCTGSPPPCNCPAGDQCVQTGQSCSACASFQCITPSSSSGDKVSGGAVAGAVIAVLAFVAICVGLYLYWRRRQLAKIAAEKAKVEETKDVPAPAETVLRRPDPSEKPPASPRLLALAQAAQAANQQQLLQQQQQQQQQANGRMYDNGTSVIELDPATYGTAHGGESQVSQNPFGDSQSIMTTSTGSQQTNVIPIALVPPGTVSARRDSAVSDASSLQPPRPIRSPNMDHLSVSRDSSLVGAPARRASGGSYVTNASFTSDIDAVIVTQSQRQVLGVGNAAVITTPLSAASFRGIPARSPLGATAFGPGEFDQNSIPPSSPRSPRVSDDPFRDAASPTRSSRATIGTNASSSLGHAVQEEEEDNRLHPYMPDVAGTSSRIERPVSTVTQAASVIGAEVVGATRVHIDYTTPLPTPLSPQVTAVGVVRANSVKRMTSARIVSPASGSSSPTRFAQQQEHAMAEVHAARAAQQARASAVTSSGDERERRLSFSTMASGVSARADSILEAFPFVPPSPISNLPPRSPLAHDQHPPRGDSPLRPPDRRMLGMSTGSELSNVSTGLGSFPFEIDHGNATPLPSTPQGNQRQTPSQGRVRASLDTLALTSDLASYPLGFDKQAEYGVPPMPRRP